MILHLKKMKRIFSIVFYRCISKEADVLKHEVIHKEELSFKGLYIDKYKRIVVREDTERVGEAFKDGLKLKK